MFGHIEHLNLLQIALAQLEQFDYRLSSHPAEPGKAGGVRENGELMDCGSVDSDIIMCLMGFKSRGIVFVTERVRGLGGIPSAMSPWWIRVKGGGPSSADKTDIYIYH